MSSAASSDRLLLAPLRERSIVDRSADERRARDAQLDAALGRLGRSEAADEQAAAARRIASAIQTRPAPAAVPLSVIALEAALAVVVPSAALLCWPGAIALEAVLLAIALPMMFLLLGRMLPSRTSLGPRGLAMLVSCQCLVLLTATMAVMMALALPAWVGPLLILGSTVATLASIVHEAALKQAGAEPMAIRRASVTTWACWTCCLAAVLVTG